MKRWLVAAIVTLAAACGSPSQSAAPTSQASAPAADGATQAPAPGTPDALDFTASLVGGGQLEGGDLAGRDVVLWFWAPW